MLGEGLLNGVVTLLPTSNCLRSSLGFFSVDIRFCRFWALGAGFIFPRCNLIGSFHCPSRMFVKALQSVVIVK